ncbi:uncharacterized protein LOC114364791 [Ostrinia furnacalis]|uniref:uncharacterized protein LOC114364791 n=1 Tax=Ostrinia furnacalis TaxID=93504 RepID=UPI00103E7F7E|nr:uncharacterized protein LOC114364791 [Ostrinia furnacalis]
MEPGYVKANSNNLPRIDAVMLGRFFATNSDFCSSEFRNVKTSMSSRASYGDDAVSYVQIKRDGKFCTLKCKICPEHKVHAKLYRCTLILNEEDEVIQSIQCEDCLASQGGCKHAIAFLMWVHRRSEEPSCTSVDCYWKKSKLSRVGSSLKYLTAKELSNGNPALPGNSAVLNKFLDEARKRKIEDCEIFKYQPTYCPRETQAASMHQLIFKFKEKNVEDFLKKIQITNSLITKVEEETRGQSNSPLWFELRYGRVTASRAYEISRCKTTDGTLISLILGGKIPDTPSMKRGRVLEDEVRKVVECKIGQKIRRCGLLLSSEYPVLAGSPDGIFEGGIIEIKCPLNEKTYKNYVKNGSATEKYNAQMQIQMFLSQKKNCFYCVADPNFSSNKKVEIINVSFDFEYVDNLIKNNLLHFWKTNIFPLLYSSVE